MFEMIAGNPFFIVAISGAITAALAFMYFQSSDSRLLPAIVIGGILTLAPILIDSLITTDRESIRNTVSRLARSVRANDVEAALEFAHPDSDLVYQKIKSEMPTYEFTMCNVTGFNSIEVVEDNAVVKFRVFVNVRAPRFGHEGVATRGMTLKMRKTSEGDWKIMDYAHYR